MQTMKREVHLSGRDLMGMVQLRPEDIGKYALVPGPKERLDSLLKKIENPIKNFTFMEYSMYTGNYAGIKLTAINGGRFSADTAITTEILCNAQVNCMIRIGSCGALRDDMKVGDLIVADSALRGEGVTPYYVKSDFQPLADKALVDTIYEAAKSTGQTVHKGKVWSTDAILRETKDVVSGVIEQGAVAVDMVTSTFLTIAHLYKVRAVAILAVSDNVITGEFGFMNPTYYMAEGAVVSIALNTVKKCEGKN